MMSVWSRPATILISLALASIQIRTVLSLCGTTEQTVNLPKQVHAHVLCKVFSDNFESQSLAAYTIVSDPVQPSASSIDTPLPGCYSGHTRLRLECCPIRWHLNLQCNNPLHNASSRLQLRQLDG